MNKYLLLTLLLTLTSKGLSKPYKDCDQTPIFFDKIIGGTDAKPGQFPWVAAIPLSNSHACGGTLISENFVLTAAHCVLSDNTKMKIVFTPGNISDTSDVYRIEMNVIQSFVHRDYNSSSFYSDIALLKMEEPVNYTRYLQPICLPEKTEKVENVTGTITGYGRARSLNFEDILQYAEVDSVDFIECVHSDPAFSKLLYRENFCAGGKGKNVCNGDSGGSFIVKDRASGKWIILGVTSRGIKMNTTFCNADSFSIFVKVTNYVDWINNIISNDPRSPIMTPYEQGEEFLKQKNYIEAERKFKEAYEKNTTHKNLYQKRYENVKELRSAMDNVKNLIHQKNFSESVNFLYPLEKKMRSDDEVVFQAVELEILEIFILKGKQLIEDKDYVECETILKDILKFYESGDRLSKEFEKYINIARAGIKYDDGFYAMGKNDFNKAIDEFDAALRYDLSEVPKLKKEIEEKRAEAMAERVRGN